MPEDVDRLTIDDFDNLTAAIDAYIEARERAAEGDR